MTERPGMGLFFRHVGQQPQRQDSLEDQLRDLHRVAMQLGCYDAADWLWKPLAERAIARVASDEDGER
jgi:hypothetical protein